MWLLENILNILPVFECLIIWHLRFLSNQDAPRDGHFKWENTNRCQFFISSTTDLDMEAWLPCDFRSLRIALCDTHEAYLLGCIRHMQHWPAHESTTEGHNKMQTRNGMESLTSSCVSCSLLHSPSGFTAEFFSFTVMQFRNETCKLIIRYCS